VSEGYTEDALLAMLRMRLSRTDEDEERRRLEEQIAELTRKARVKPMSMDDVRSHTIKCLYPLAGLSKKDRQRVLKHALKVAAV